MAYMMFITTIALSGKKFCTTSVDVYHDRISLLFYFKSVKQNEEQKRKESTPHTDEHNTELQS